MTFQLGNGILFLPPIHITLIAIVVIFLLVRWGKQLETRRFTVLYYFLFSTFITPFISYSTGDVFIRLWFPLGFIIVFAFLIGSERDHPSKRKACFLGLFIAFYQMLVKYMEYF